MSALDNNFFESVRSYSRHMVWTSTGHVPSHFLILKHQQACQENFKR